MIISNIWTTFDSIASGKWCAVQQASHCSAWWNERTSPGTDRVYGAPKKNRQRPQTILEAKKMDTQTEGSTGRMYFFDPPVLDWVEDCQVVPRISVHQVVVEVAAVLWWILPGFSTIQQELVEVGTGTWNTGFGRWVSYGFLFGKASC